MKKISKDKKTNDESSIIHYKKGSEEEFHINIGKIERGDIKTCIEVANNKPSDSKFEFGDVEYEQEQPLGIAPHHVRDYQIKKPDEKEPSLIRVIKDRWRNDDKKDPLKQKKRDKSD